MMEGKCVNIKSECENKKILGIREEKERERERERERDRI